MSYDAEIAKCLDKVTNLRDAMLTEHDARIVLAVFMASNAGLCAALRTKDVYSTEVVIRLWTEALVTSLTETIKDVTVTKVPVLPPPTDGKPN